jgi:hypothetical protein
LKALGYEFPLGSTGGNGTGEALADQDKAPPELTVSILVDALDRMPNPLEKERPFYEKVMQSIAGARRGIIAWHGSISVADEKRICDAAVGWVLRWPGWQDPQRLQKHGNDPKQFETEKWNGDWKDNGGHYVTWWNLIDHARECGLDGLPDFAAEEAARAMESAQREFSAEQRPEGETGRYRAQRNDGRTITSWGDTQHPWYVLDTSNGIMMAGFDSEEDAREAAQRYERDQKATTDSALPNFAKMAEKPALIVEYASDFFVEAGLPLVDGWIDQGELVSIVGAPGSWKTTLMADLAGCVAWERPWMGCKTAGGAILVVELEGARGFRNRVIAWHKYHGLDYRAAPIGMVSQGITLTEGANGEDTKRVIAAAKAVAEKTDLPLRLIMVDTMSRVIGPGKDEDRASDISALVQAVNEIQRQTGAAVALIHHVGLTDGTRGRGSSNQRASWDVDLLVQAEGMFGTVSAPKQREKEKLPPIAFATIVVEIGTRQDGKAIASCVTRAAEQGEMPKAKAQGPKLGKNESLLLLALKEQRDGWQPLPKGPAFPPSGFGMVKDELRNAFYPKLDSDMTGSGRRMALNRALSTLVNAGLIGMDSDWVWLIGQPGAEFDTEERQ